MGLVYVGKHTVCICFFPSNIEWDLNQPAPLELLDTQVFIGPFSGSDRWRFLGFFHDTVPEEYPDLSPMFHRIDCRNIPLT